MKKIQFRGQPLIDYVPPVTSDIIDLKALYAAEELEFDRLTSRAEWTGNSFFVELVDDESIRLWENVFQVNNSDMPLEQRKREIIKLLAGFKKLSTSSIEKIVLDYTSYLCRCVFNKLTSEIEVSFIEVGQPPGMEALIRYLDVLSPAHLHVVLVELYRTHQVLRQYIHSYLKRYTHDELFQKRNLDR